MFGGYFYEVGAQGMVSKVEDKLQRCVMVVAALCPGRLTELAGPGSKNEGNCKYEQSDIYM